MKLKVFRSLWGTELHTRDWATLFADIAREGYTGIEASLGDVGHRAEEFLARLKEHNMEYICGVYTSWQDYEGPWEDKPVPQHLEQFRAQLQRAKALKPIHINSHSGQDSWTESEAEEFFRGALAIEQEEGVCVSHETHRGRVLFNPWVTVRLLEKFSTLKLTGDFSHWVIVAERLLSQVSEVKLMEKVVSRVWHIHARVGDVEHPQVADVTAPEAAAARRWHETWWRAAWEARRAAGAETVTATPEYGPPPYAPGTPGAPSLWDATNTAKRELVSFFDKGFGAAPAAERYGAVEVVDHTEAQGNFDTIPIIDISAFTKEGADEAAKRATAELVHQACQNVGFLYVTGHNVDKELLRDAYNISREFFNLSVEDKAEIALAKSKQKPPCRGYQRLGENVTQGQRDWHEAIDFYKHFELDHPDVVRGLPLHGPNQWPSKPAAFKDIYERYIAAMQKLGRNIFSAMSMGLGLAPDYFEPYVNDSFWVMRVIGYPPVAERVGEGISCGEHTDYGCLTIVNQDATRSALQVKNKRGEWIDANPVPESFVVNIGDMMSIWTGGQYRSTPHRVINRANQFRISVPFFFEPNFDAKIQRLATCGGDGTDKPVVYGQHLLSKVANNFSLIDN